MGKAERRRIQQPIMNFVFSTIENLNCTVLVCLAHTVCVTLVRTSLSILLYVPVQCK